MYITDTLPNRGHNRKGYDRENIGVPYILLTVRLGIGFFS